jgi:hypothetical protein
MIRDILVHLDGSSADETSILHAEAIAGPFDARVIGLLTNIVPTPIDAGCRRARRRQHS